jgi:tetratricopeptide (TPR) repeat protein
MNLIHERKTITHALIVLFLSLFASAGIYGQGKQAVIILRSPGSGSSVSDCDGGVELNYQIVTDLKLNAKDEVRLASGLSAQSDSTSISRKEYESTGKSKLKDLSMLKWDSNGMLYAISVGGQSPILALPDNSKPPKEANPALSSFYSVMITGEARDGKQKRKINLALRDVWKIYFTAEGSTVNDTLFRHATDEKSVALWEAFLKKTNQYRSSEANTFMREALITCARADLDAFLQGNYAAFEKAREKTERAKSVKDDETTRQLAGNITQAKQKVDDIRGQVFQLISASKWDEAITAAEPIKKYLTTWPDLNGMYSDTLKRSHAQHLFQGEEALRANQLDVALKDCTIARERVPDSAAALDCVCKSRNRVALRDSSNHRKQRRPKDAKEILEHQLADTDCSRDDAVAKALSEAKCEYAQQLLDESRQLIALGGGPRGRAIAPAPTGRRGRGRGAAATLPVQNLPVNVKPISAQSKKDFRTAREKLLLAFELCQDEPVRALLEAANRTLSGYCLEEARKAMQRNDYGTAYVYLQSAQGYTPADSSVLELLSEARNQFQERTRVSIGVVFENSSGREFDVVLNEVAASVESVATDAGLSQPVILDHREAANAWRAIQGSKNLNSPTAIFSGELVSASLNRSDNPRSVRSSYSYENPNWKEADRIHDAVNEDLKKCRKQAGVDCSGLQGRVDQLRAARDRYQRTVTEYYSYRENLIRVTGGLRMSFRFTDSVSRGVRAADTLEGTVGGECVEREGVHRQDYSARDSTCNIPDRTTLLSGMIEKLKRDAHLKAFEQLRALPGSYYTRARSSANRQQSVEDYLRFLFLTSDKSGEQAQEAQRALVSFDPELKTDGMLR